jgi:hypothetical protein
VVVAEACAQFVSVGKMEWKVKEICRLCARGDDVVLRYIFDDSAGEESLVSKIWNCVGLKVPI